MILVRIRCHQCRRVLREVEQRPDDWDGVLRVRTRCRCRPSPGRVVRVMARSGLSGWGMWAEVPWSLIRPYIERAEGNAKTEDMPIRVLHPRRDDDHM